MSTTVEITPWPRYSEAGRGPFWDVRVTTESIKCWLQWSPFKSGFIQSGEYFRLRHKDPSAYRAAMQHMSKFGAKVLDLGADKLSAKADTKQTKPDSGQPDSSRARPYSVGDVRLSARTLCGPDTDKQGGQQELSAELGQPSAWAPGSPVRSIAAQQDKKRLAADPRFASWALWAAGMESDGTR